MWGTFKKFKLDNLCLIAKTGPLVGESVCIPSVSDCAINLPAKRWITPHNLDLDVLTLLIP